MKRPWIFLSDPEDPNIPESEINHLKVLRIKDGEEVIGFDGHGGIFLGRIKGKKFIKLKEYRYPRTEPFISLIFPLIKREKLEFVIRYAPLFDTHEIILFQADRSEVRKIPVKGKIERWKYIMISSCKQCHNPYLPSLLFLELKNIKPQRGELGILLDELETKRNLGDIKWEGIRKIYIAVGPEGGFSDNERKTLIEKNFISVSLGPRILTSEIAAISSLSILRFLLENTSKRQPCEMWFFDLSRHKAE